MAASRLSNPSELSRPWTDTASDALTAGAPFVAPGLTLAGTAVGAAYAGGWRRRGCGRSGECRHAGRWRPPLGWEGGGRPEGRDRRPLCCRRAGGRRQGSHLGRRQRAGADRQGRARAGAGTLCPRQYRAARRGRGPREAGAGSGLDAVQRRRPDLSATRRRADECPRRQQEVRGRRHPADRPQLAGPWDPGSRGTQERDWRLAARGDELACQGIPWGRCPRGLSRGQEGQLREGCGQPRTRGHGRRVPVLGISWRRPGHSRGPASGRRPQ